MNPPRFKPSQPCKPRVPSDRLRPAQVRLAVRLALGLILVVAGAALWACVLSPLDTSAAPALEVFVSPSGDDDNPGTQARPFASIDRAKEAVRGLRRSCPRGRATVWLLPGAHFRKASLVLDSSDSGAPGSPVIYSALPGRTATLTGGRALEREWFTPTRDAAILSRIVDPSARTRVTKVDLRAHGIADLGENQRRGFTVTDTAGPPPIQLYVSGKRMILARWPNEDERHPAYLHPFVKDRPGVVSRSGILDPGPKFGEPGFADRGPVYRYNFDRPRYWTGAKDLWLNGIFNSSWEWSCNRVAKIDPVARTMAMRWGEYNGVAEQYSGNFFFAENLIEELDRPGEYWIDRDTGVLYLIPPAGFDEPGTTITVSTLSDAMIELRNASNVTFRALNFELGRGFAFKSEGGSDVLLDHCAIHDFVAGGVSLTGRRHGLQACRLTGIGGTPVSLAGGDVTTLEPGECFVDGCVISDNGWYHLVYHPAISLDGVAQRASHNRIRNHPHLAIGVTGNDHLIEFNDLADVCTDFSDMGAIYIATGSDPLQRGTVIRRNYIHDIGRFPFQNGVYVDNGTMGIIIEENVFARIGSANPQAANCQAINNNSCAYVAARNNIFIDCPLPYLLGAYSARNLYESHLKEWKQVLVPKQPINPAHIRKYPELALFWNENRRFPQTNSFERNLIWNPGSPLLKEWRLPGTTGVPAVSGAAQEYPGLEIRDNWVASADPGFVDFAKGNLNLAQNGEAFGHIPGFRLIPFLKIGPRSQTGPGN